MTSTGILVPKGGKVIFQFFLQIDSAYCKVSIDVMNRNLS